jgi:hypothetical protein
MSIHALPRATGGGLVICAALWSLALAGCQRDEIQTYRVAKEPVAAQAAPLPKGWEEAPPGEMRVASYHIKGAAGKSAEVSVIPLPVAAARDLDNVNRWRGAVSLPPVTETELEKLAQPIQVGAETAKLYDQAGANSGSGDKERILVAVLRREGQAWFFKLSGDDELVTAQKQPFLDYVKTFDFANPAGHGSSAGMEAGQLPPSHPPIGDMGSATARSPAAGSDASKPDWTVPTGWKETSGQFLVAKFLISGTDNSQASVNVSVTGGGVAMNVNRWRGQVGLEPASEPDIDKQGVPVDTGGGTATLFDMSGKDGRTGDAARIIGIVLPREQQTWFYKLMGPPALVEQNKDKFLTFVKTVKYRS